MPAITLTPVRLWLVLAALLTAGALGAYLIMQQTQRLGANDPQVQMAEDGAAALERGRSAADIVGRETTDVARSIAPFIIVLDDAGKPVASSGRLDGQMPIPPAGVLANARTAGEERVTWAPRASIRLASVVRRVNGPVPGFVVAARSLREAEAHVAGMSRLIATGWLVALLGAVVAVTLLAWTSRQPA